MDVRWMTAFIDRPGAGHDAACHFWATVTGSTISPVRGTRDEFLTLMPPSGDAFLRVQRVLDGPGGGHLDLHVDDPRTAASDASALGAREVARPGGIVIMRSPGGLSFCLVEHHGEEQRPEPTGAHGQRVRVDQLSIDVAPDRFEVECEFLAAMTGWPLQSGYETEYRALEVPANMPFRVLLQRRGDDNLGTPSISHLDLSCDDIGSAERMHLDLGATLVERFPWWTVMADPSGEPYCLTRRDVDTGLPHS